MKTMKNILFAIVILLTVSCQNSMKSTKDTDSSHSYPPAAGFDLDSSDVDAILIADEVMKAQGGYENWQNTKYLRWNFFGKRTLLWDKFTGNVRIEMSDDLKNTIIVNVNTGVGKAEKEGVEITDETELKALLEKGKSVWINDAYWLVMPFKLKDSGVTLKYIGAEKLETKDVDVLQLTFENVGDTPENKYYVYVDKTTKLVIQWAFFTNFEDKEPRFKTPWKDYSKHGNIMLSGNRGKNSLTDIAVLETVEESVFVEL